MRAFRVNLRPGLPASLGVALLAGIALLLGASGCLTLRFLGRLGKVLPDGPGDALTIPAYSVQDSRHPDALQAGAARVDITPPPGYPTGGDSLAAAVTRGYWIRLSARAFYFENKQGRRLVLVSAELFAIPEALHARVSELINKEWTKVRTAGHEAGLTVGETPLPLSPDELVIAATHTHQGPGNFLSSKVYNSFASMYSGFNLDLFEFLALRIAAAVAAAATSAKTDSDAVSLKLHDRDDIACHELGGNACGYRQQLTRNRMPFVIGLNPDRKEAVDAMNPNGRCGPRLCADRLGFPVPAAFDAGRFCEPDYGWDDTQGCPRLQSVNPRMTVLEVTKTAGATERVVGLLVFFAAHPTVLAPSSPVYNGDFASVAMRAIERRHADQPVAAFFNGAEGDIHMRRLRRDFRDAVRLGTLFERAVFETLDSPAHDTTSDPAISVGRIEVTDFAAADSKDPGKRRGKEPTCSKPLWRDALLAQEPQYGVAGLGGAEGDRTVLVQLGWQEGVRSQPQKGQGPKLPGLDSSVLRNLKITDLVAPPEDFPAHLPVTYARLGSLAIGTFPVELTTTMGYRIRHSLGLDAPGSRFVLIGLANSYSSYVATPDEYYAQDYVGASTMWGPREGLALGCGLESLVAATSTRPQTDVPAVVFHPGPKSMSPFGAAFTGDARIYPTEELNDVLLDPEGLPAVDLPWFSWTESVAGCKTRNGEVQNEDCLDFPAAASRRISIETWDGTAWKPRTVTSEFAIDHTPLPPPPYKAGPPPPDDDLGNNLLTLLMDASHPPSRTWAVVWAATLFEQSVPVDVPFHFRVERSTPDGSSEKKCSLGRTLDAWRSEQARIRKNGDLPVPLPEAPCDAAPSLIAGGAAVRNSADLLRLAAGKE
jgi:neutral ceramidase